MSAGQNRARRNGIDEMENKMTTITKAVKEVFSRASLGNIIRERLAAEGIEPRTVEKHCCSSCSPSGLLTLADRNRLMFLILPLAIFALFQLPTPALAYGEQITQAGIQLYSWIRGLGAVVMVLGLAGVGIKLMITHDREGLTPFFYVVLGGLVIMLSPSIVGLIQGVAGGAAAINTAS